MINYLVHDVTAGSDAKIVGLLMKHGCLGYGVYWRIIEQMACTTDGMLATDYNKLGWLIREKANIVKSVICDFELFKFSDDKKFFFSERLKKSLEAINEKSQKAKESAEKRWKKQSDGNAVAEPKQSDSNTIAMPKQSERNTNAMPTQCERIANAMQIKQDKIKEDNSITPLNPPKGEKVEEILLPPTLDFPEFKSAWKDWVAYRKEKRQPLKASTVKSQIKFLAEHPAEAVEMIQQSIRNGWQGLFELKDYTKALRQPVMTNNQELDVYKHFLEGGN